MQNHGLCIDAFLRLIFYLTTGLGYSDLEPEDIIDGQGEYQIDVMHIDDSGTENQVTVTIIQVTFSESLSSSRLIRLHTGLDYLIHQPRAEYQKLSNIGLREKIEQFRALRSEFLPSNIRIQCFYANLLDPSLASGEFPEQVARINADFAAAVGDFKFEPLGPSAIFDLMDRRERRGTKVNERIRIIYDQNKANLIEHSIEGVSGVVCTFPGSEIARIVNAHPAIFEENLRRFRGLGGSVNKAIMESCTTSPDASQFWFLNNGITIVCDSFDINKDYDNPFISIENLQIVNGCQTSAAIAKAEKDELLQPVTQVLVRVLKTNSPDLADRLVVTTNNQNRITARELKAKDSIQYSIQSAFENRFDLWYERTSNEFAGIARQERRSIISNQRLGQAYLAVALKRPGDARGRLYKIWSEDYEGVFNANVYPEAYLLSYKIVEKSKELKRIKYPKLRSDIRKAILANGVMHLARTMAFLWRRSDNWTDQDQLLQDIEALDKNPDILDPYFEHAIDILDRIFKRDSQFRKDPSIALKSPRMDREINRSLYRRKR